MDSALKSDPPDGARPPLNALSTNAARRRHGLRIRIHPKARQSVTPRTIRLSTTPSDPIHPVDSIPQPTLRTPPPRPSVQIQCPPPPPSSTPHSIRRRLRFISAQTPTPTRLPSKRPRIAIAGGVPRTQPHGRADKPGPLATRLSALQARAHCGLAVKSGLVLPVDARSNGMVYTTLSHDMPPVAVLFGGGVDLQAPDKASVLPSADDPTVWRGACMIVPSPWYVIRTSASHELVVAPLASVLLPDGIPQDVDMRERNAELEKWRPRGVHADVEMDVRRDARTRLDQVCPHSDSVFLCVQIIAYVPQLRIAVVEDGAGQIAWCTFLQDVRVFEGNQVTLHGALSPMRLEGQVAAAILGSDFDQHKVVQKLNKLRQSILMIQVQHLT